MADIDVYSGIDGEIEDLEASISLFKGTYASYCNNRNHAATPAEEEYWDDKCFEVSRDIAECEQELERLREEKHRQNRQDSIVPW